MDDTLIISEIVDEAMKEININIINSYIDRRRRSGSQPNHPKSKKIKDSDLVSITTMAQTKRSHGSERKIEEGAYPWKMNAQMGENEKKFGGENENEKSTWRMMKKGTIYCQNNDISAIKYYFIKVANERKLKIMRDLDNIVTVKSSNSQSFGCFFKYCLAIYWDRSVYQLERSMNSKGSRIKITLVSGSQHDYEEFKKTFYYDLWQNGILELDDFEAIKLYCSVNKQIFTDALKSYKKAYNECDIMNLDSPEEVEKWELSLMKEYKETEDKMFIQIFEEKKKVAKTNENMEFLSLHLLNLIPIEEFYIKSKISKSKKIEERKKNIHCTFTISSMFDFLELREKFKPFIQQTRNKTINLVRQEGGKLPFQEAFAYLEDLSFGVSPAINIKLIEEFTLALFQTYKSLCLCGDPVLDMDNQLPLTIYCLLCCKNTQLKPLVSLLSAYLQFEDSCENQKRTLAALNASLDFICNEWPQNY